MKHKIPGMVENGEKSRIVEHDGKKPVMVVNETKTDNGWEWGIIWRELLTIYGKE